MVQRRDRPRLAIEPFQKTARETLIATRSMRVSRALYTSPILPSPIAATISYGPKRVPGATDTQQLYRGDICEWMTTKAEPSTGYRCCSACLRYTEGVIGRLLLNPTAVL